MATTYRIRDWNEHFENNRTRELKRLTFVPMPNKQDGDGYTELVEHENGAAHLGAWAAIVQIASKCEPRGTLLRDGARPHDSVSLGRISRLGRKVFDEAIPRLIEIGWLETESPQVNVVSEDTSISQEGATLSHDPAPACGKAPIEGNGREWNGREQKDVCAETENPSSAPPVLTFPTDGKVQEWHLEQSHIDEWCEAYPSLDILAECRKALAWIHANPERRKTARGMPKFLVNWLNRAQNSGGGSRAGPASKPVPRRGEIAEKLREQRERKKPP